MPPKQMDPYTSDAKPTSNSSEVSEAFASIKDQSLLPPSTSSQRLPHLDGNMYAQPQPVLQRLSRPGSNPSPTEGSSSSKHSFSAPAQAPSADLTDPSLGTHTLAMIRQAHPVSPLMASLMGDGESVVVAADPALHSSGSLSVICSEPESSSVANSTNSRWATTSASAAAALASAAAAVSAHSHTGVFSTPSTPMPPLGTMSAPWGNGVAVFTAEESSPNSSSGHHHHYHYTPPPQHQNMHFSRSQPAAGARPRTSPLQAPAAVGPHRAGTSQRLSNSATASAAMPFSHLPAAAVTAAAVVAAAPQRTSPLLSPFPSLLSPPNHALSAVLPVAAGPAMAHGDTPVPLALATSALAESRDPHASSQNLLSVPRRKLRESEVSFSVDLLRTAPSAPLAVNAACEGSRSDVFPSSPPLRASPSAESLSFLTAACVLSPGAPSLLLSAEEVGLVKCVDGLDAADKRASLPAEAELAVASAASTTHGGRVPHPPPLAPRPTSLHGSATAFAGTGATSTSSSRGASATSAHSSVTGAATGPSLHAHGTNMAAHNTNTTTSGRGHTAHRGSNGSRATTGEACAPRSTSRARRPTPPMPATTSLSFSAAQPLGSANATTASGTLGNHTVYTHSTDDGQPTTAITSAAGTQSGAGLSHGSSSNGRGGQKTRDNGSGHALRLNGSGTGADGGRGGGGGGGGGGENSMWASSTSAVLRDGQIVPFEHTRRFFVPMNLVVILNLIVTVVIVALLAILPLNEVSMRTINYITSVLSKGLSSSFAASTEANLFFLPLALRSFIASWMLDQHVQFRSWTRDDMPEMMQGMCNLIQKTSSNSHLLYVGLYSPYSGYSAYCSPQYFNGTSMYGNYIINNESQPRYRIAPDLTYAQPLMPLEEVHSMTPWEETVEFGAPNNSWLNVAVPWYDAYVAINDGIDSAGQRDVNASTATAPETSPEMSRKTAQQRWSLPDEHVHSTTVASIAEGWWVKTIGNTSVITYSWPFIDYEGNLAMFTAALQPAGFYNLLAQSLSSASLGRAMVLDPMTGMVLVSSWREEPAMRMDNWKWDQCEDCRNSDTLYVDELTDPLMKAAVASLGGRSGIFDKPHSVSEWEHGFVHRGKAATVFAQRILFTDRSDTSSEARTMLHLVLIYAIEKAEYSSNVELVRSAILASVALTLAIIAVMDMALIYLFLRPLRNLAVGLRDAAQLRDGSSIVASRISAIKEVASMQQNFFLMNQQLMQMKAFVPQGVLGPTASAWSGSEHGTEHNSEFGNDDSFVFFTGPRPVDSREVSSISTSLGRGGANGAAGGRSPVVHAAREDADDEQLPFEQDALVSAAYKGIGMHATSSPGTTAAAAAAENLRLNERALFDEVNRFRRRYCTVMVACMHICERDLVNQPKMELLISMFMNAAIPVILKDGGVIESQRPDSLVVSFGAHSRMAMHQTRGARCALEIIHRVNEYPALGARVGCMVDVSEFYVGTFGAAQRNARVTYGVRMPSSLELVKLYKSLDTQILLTQKLAASLDRQFLVMPIDSLLFTLDSKSRVLYELRGSARSLPAAIPEAHVRSIIKAVRYGFNKMVHGEYEGALRYLEPYVHQDDQVRRLALACYSLVQRGVTKPYIRSIGRIKLSEASVLYDVEEQEHVRRAAESAAEGVLPANISHSSAQASTFVSSSQGGMTSASTHAGMRTPGSGAPSTSFTSRQYLQRAIPSGAAPHSLNSPTARKESTAGLGPATFTSTVSPVDPMLEAAIRRQHNKKGLRIIAGATPIDDELTTPKSGLETGGTVAVAVADSTTNSPHGDPSEGAAAADDMEAGALFEMYIDVDDGDGPEVSTLASTTHTVTEEAMGGGGGGVSSGSVDAASPGLLVQASAAPGRGGAGDGSDSSVSGAGGGAGGGCENVGDLPTMLEDYEGNMWFRSADRLGVGAFSVVYRGLSASGNLVALKCFQLLSRNVDYEAVSEEVRLFASLHHENIVQYVSVYISDTFFVEIMELVPGGSLDALLKSFGRIQKRALRRFLRDILRGLQYLHSMNIVHCDVKPHNVLLAMDGQCKLSDFGSAMSRATTSMAHIEDVLELRGTPAYLAPEVARGEIPTMKSDVFSLGVTVLELIDGALPWRFPDTAEATGHGRAHRGQRPTTAAAAHSRTRLDGAADEAETEGPSSTAETTATTPSPLEQYRRMWRRSTVNATLENRPDSGDGVGSGEDHTDGASGPGTPAVLDATTAGLSATPPSAAGTARGDGSESPTRVFPRFQRRATCAPSSCPLIDDLEGLVGRGQSHNGSASECVANASAGAAVSSTSPAVDSRPASCSAATAFDGVPSGNARPASAEVTAEALALDRIVRNPTQLIRSIANGTVMPNIPDDLAADEELVDFLRLCLHPDATQRASADQLLNHSWLM